MNSVNKFPENFYNHLRNNTMVEIKAGLTRDKFTGIWMVNVNERVFARTWEKSDKGWFAGLLKDGVGTIKYGNNTLKVYAKKNKDPIVNKLVDKAYLDKYSQPENLIYAEGITRKEYSEYTVELFFSK